MNLGFFIPNITQQNPFHQTLIRAINELCILQPYDNIVVFNNYFNFIDPNKKYYILSTNHAKYFSGLLFSFDMQSVFMTQTFPGPKKQIIYLQEPEWANKTNMPYTLWYNIYMSDRFDIIAGNQDVYDLMSICWKPAIEHMSQFNAKELQNVIQQLIR